MSAEEAVTVLATRCNSLEDILRQQEQTISVLLGRIRDLEQFVGNEARNRDANQNQINQILSDRSSENLSERIGLILQNQSERLSALQADAQSQRATLQGLDGKLEAAFHGLENKVQGDLRTLQERVASGERATSEALQITQSSLQAQAAAVQQIDSKCRDAVQGLQAMVRDGTDTARSNVEALEGRTRDALRDLHGTLRGDITAASTQLESLIHQAIRNQNEAMLTLDQRVRTEVGQLHQQEQADFQTAQQRMAAIEVAGRELVQATQSGLASEIAAVAKHSQAVDSRQQGAHQALVQELSKHDQQMEAIDVNWRASVTDLNGKVDAEVATTRAQQAAGDQALQGQVGQLRDQLRAVGEKLNHDLNDLAGRVQDNCVVPLERLNVTVTKQDGTLSRLIADADKTREFLRVFAQEVDRNANQFRQLLEATLRASHSDLLERINVVSASVALRQDPEAVYAQINEALSKIWADSSSSFATQRDVNDMQSQITNLESAIRVEIHALAEKDNALHHRIDEVQVPLRWVVERQQAPATSTTAAPVASRDLPSESGQRELKQYASAAGAAQDECVRIANEMRTALTEVRSARKLVEAVAARDVTPAPSTPTPTEKGGEEAQPNAQQAAAARALAAQKQEEATARAEALLAEVQQAQKAIMAYQEDIQTRMAHERDRHASLAAASASTVGPTPGRERVPSAGSVRRVSGTQNGSTFIVRSLDASAENPFSGLADDGESEPSVAVDAPSPTAYAGRNNEILLPTHQFVRKKEYANFKDFTKQELDALWVEVLNLRRTNGVSREELMMHLAQSKGTILSGVLNAMAKQENEMVGILSSLKLQVAKSLGDGTIKTDVRIFPPHNGTIDMDQLIRDVDSLSARLGQPTIQSNTNEPPPPPPAQPPLMVTASDVPARTVVPMMSNTQEPRRRQLSSVVPPPPPSQNLAGPSAAASPITVGAGAQRRQPSVADSSSSTPLPPQHYTSPRPQGDVPSVASSARSTEPLQAQLIPRVATYAVGSANPTHEAPLYASYSSPYHQDALVASPRITQPPLHAAYDPPHPEAVSASPPRIVGSIAKPASPLAPPSLTRDRYASAAAPLPLPHLYATEPGSQCAVHAPDTDHVSAWEREPSVSAPRPSSAGAPPPPAELLKPTSAPSARNAKGSAFHLNPLQGVHAAPGAAEAPPTRPIQSAPMRTPTQLAPLPNAASSPMSYPTEAQLPAQLPVQPRLEPPPQRAPPPPEYSPAPIEDEVNSSIPIQSDTTPVLPELYPSSQGDRDSARRDPNRRHRHDRDDPPEDYDGGGDYDDDLYDGDDGDYVEEEDDEEEDYVDERGGGGGHGDRDAPRHRPRRARRKVPRSDSKPRTRSSSRSAHRPSSRRRGGSRASSGRPRSPHSQTNAPNSPEPVSRKSTTPPLPPPPAPAPAAAVVRDAMPGSKPRPAGSANIRVYPSPEGVRLGTFSQPSAAPTGTSGHIYAPSKNASRGSTYSSAARDEL